MEDSIGKLRLFEIADTNGSPAFLLAHTNLRWNGCFLVDNEVHLLNTTLLVGSCQVYFVVVAFLGHGIRVTFLIHINKLISTIRNNRQERFTQKQVEDITNKIKELNQTGVLNKINHILYVKKRQNANKKSK